MPTGTTGCKPPATTGGRTSLEIQLAQALAAGKPVAGVTWDAVHEMNAAHAKEHDGVTKEEALDLLRRNSTAAAAAIRALSDEQLDRDGREGEVVRGMIGADPPLKTAAPSVSPALTRSRQPCRR